MCSGCFLKANGLQVDARSRNGPEKIEYRMDYGSRLGGQIETKSIKKRSQFSRRFWKAFFMDSDPILDAFCLYFRELFRVTFRTCESKDYIYEKPIRNQGPDPQKSIKHRWKNVIGIRKRFLFTFWQIWPRFWPPNWSRLATEGLPKTCPKPVAASRHRKATKGTYVQMMSLRAKCENTRTAHRTYMIDATRSTTADKLQHVLKY